MGVIKVIGGFIAAVFVLTVLATVLQSVFVLAALSGVGAQIGAGDAAGMIMADLAGLGPLYGAFIAIALLVAFLAGALVHRFTPAPRGLVFPVAGLAAMAVMLLAMEQVFFGVQLIAGARTTSGFAAQLLAGLVAGYAFSALTPAPKRRTA
jgi:hypothetical protein